MEGAVGRRRNEELDALLMRMYALGYTPRMMVDTLVERLGKRYSVRYIRKRLSRLRREGRLTSKASVRAWDEAIDWYKSAKAHLAAAQAALAVKGASGVREAEEELGRALAALERMVLALRQLYAMYAGKVVQ